MSHPWYMLPLIAMVALVILWIAFKVGRFVLRVIAGLVLLGLFGLVLWYLFLR